MKFDLRMAAASVGLGFRNERSKKRRHSYTSAKAFAARPVASPPARTSSSLRRSGSFSESHKVSESDRRDSVGGLLNSGRRSFTKFLRSIRRKKSSQSSLSDAHTSTSTISSELSYPQAPATEQKGQFVRVGATVLHPEIIYKTLPITKHSTVFEVVVKLVSKYALSQEDRDNPDAFYLTEVRESEQGSYSRLLENSDRVYDIQSRWENEGECSFILCRKESFKIEDDPFLDSPLEALVMSPSQDYFETGFTGVVDVDVPSVPTSPNSYSNKTSFFGGLSAATSTTADPLHNSLPVSPSELSTDDVFIVSDENPPMSAPSSAGVDVGRLMQQSVSEGMLGIMNRVIIEGTQREHTPFTDHTPSMNRQRRATESDVTPRGRGEMTLRPLVCSPMESAERKFPEFVFTPQVSTTESTNVGSRGLAPLSFEETDTPSNHKPPPSPLCRASTTLSSVRFTTDHVFHPCYTSHASVHPSSSRSTQYHSAMDSSDSLYSMLKNQLQPSPGVQSSSLKPSKDALEGHGKTLRRYHTFHVGRDQLQLHLGEGSEEAPSLHIQRVTCAIRQRRSVGGIRLSESESVPRLSRAESSNTNVSHSSTLSISSEVATDLDTLRDTRMRPSTSEHHLPPLSSHIVHSRTDSDGVFEMRTRGMYRGSSGSSIQATGLDSAHCRRYPRTTSDSFFTTVNRQEIKQSIEGIADHNRMCSSGEVIDSTDTGEVIDSTDTEGDEVLYTFQHNLRPVTVLVRSKPSQEGEQPQHSPNKVSEEKSESHQTRSASAANT